MEELYNRIRSLFFLDRKDKDFVEYLQEILNSYVKILEDSNAQKKDFIDNIKTYNEKIKKCVICYFEGRYSIAYKFIKELLDDLIKDDRYLIQKNEVFYRSRLPKKEQQFSLCEEMFHTPFNMRNKVTTQRYSAPGYPCLYLGKSIVDCWIELGRPQFNTLFTSQFVVQEDFYVLDLRIPELENLDEDKFATFLKKTPLILSCSLVVEERTDPFKPEYIIPQRIIEYVITKNKEKYEEFDSNTHFNSILGVYYTSTHLKDRLNFPLKLFHNLALPAVIIDGDSNYCSLLASCFKLTKPTCYEYEEIKKRFYSPFEEIEEDLSLTEEEKNYKYSKIKELEDRLTELPKEKLNYCVFDRTELHYPASGGRKDLHYRINP